MRERSDRAPQAASKQLTDLRAVLCDMDGTLVDTEGRWTEAVEPVAAALDDLLADALHDRVSGTAQ